MFLNIEEIIEATGGKLVSSAYNTIIKKIDTDSRCVGQDSLFVALKGENNDAHKFLDDVIQKGCKAVVVSDLNKSYDANVILVKDTKIALGDIARYYVKKLSLTKKFVYILE